MYIMLYIYNTLHKLSLNIEFRLGDFPNKIMYIDFHNYVI